jgi:branched-chain amino acid transport system substrate-binding protein
LSQLDYGAELSKIRASGADAVYIFLPGGMGINFIKQFVGAGLSKDMTLFGPGFSADEDVIRAVGDPMLGMFNTSQWAHDIDNAANKRLWLISRRNMAACPPCMPRKAMTQRA